jgi:hypothetical protein
MSEVVDGLTGALSSAAAEPVRIDVAIRVAADVFVLQLVHAAGMGLQSILAGMEHRIVPRLVERAHLAEEIVVRQLVCGDAAAGSSHVRALPR